MLAIVNCAQIVTLRGPKRPRVGAEMREISIIENGSVLVDGGVIHDVGPSNSIDSGQASQIIDGSGCVLMPGWVDAHTHLVFGGSRAEEFEQRCSGKTYQEIAASGGGIRSTMRATRAASEAELVEQGRRHAGWCLKTGTTTVEAKSGYGLTLDDELKILRALKTLQAELPLTIEPTFLGAHAFPPEFERDHDGYVDLIAGKMLPEVQRLGLARWCDIFVESNYFTAGQARIIATAAKAHSLKMRMHVDQLSNGRGAHLAAELQARTADHLEQVDAQGIAELVRANVMPVLLPASVYCLGLQHYPPARAMIEAGLPVVLATDFNPGSSPTTSIPLVLSLACTHMKMTPAEAVTAATINAAYSLDLPDRGTIEPGSRADLALYECRDYREIAYYAGVPLLRDVLCAGVRVTSS